MPGDKEVVYASTHLASDACPPPPDHSQGYVWPLHDTYDIFKVKLDGTGEQRLTDTKGYDAEATVCGKDGSIVFTSTRDGDIELYRMDADGKNVKRLTHTVGYDGGAFFNHDCTKIVWRASRPKPGKEEEEFKALLAKNLVRPSKLELYVANADGSDAVQLTYLNTAAFAPFWFPGRDRIIFSANYGDPKAREFELWAIDADGTDLERITYTPGFDGFPMFSPDGKQLVFASNRATPEGKRDTNVFVARWVERRSKPMVETAAERVRKQVVWLADPARQGRGIGTLGLTNAGEYLEKRFHELGLQPAGDSGSFRQSFPVKTAVRLAPGSTLNIGGQDIATTDFSPLGFSADGLVKAPLVLAGYGIREPSLKVDDYAKVNVKGKVAVVRRFVPEGETFSETERQRRFGDIRYKAWVAKERGAKALLVVDWPVAPKNPPADWKMPTEAKLPALHPEGFGDAGIPVLAVKRSALEKVWPALEKRKPVEADLKVTLQAEQQQAFNVVGRIPAGAPEAQRSKEVVVVGAHYDHLGLGGRDSLAPDRTEPHLGADDNASGVAALLEIGRELMERKSELRRDVILVAFSGEEVGALGSSHFVRSPPAGVSIQNVAAMLNLDMVGRLRSNHLSVLGADSSQDWASLVGAACDRARVQCTTGGDGYGPSDQMPFYAAGVPVLHFFTGVHSDYHKPSDTPARINAAGLAQVAKVAADVAAQVSSRDKRVSYKKMKEPAPRGDMRSFNASLGTIPEYAGPPAGQKGVLLAGVRPGGGAEQAGMRRGDILVKLGKHEIGSVEDLMFVLNASKPGETVKAVVIRDGKEVELEATFQESKRR
jgi:hypothetical protein